METAGEAEQDTAVQSPGAQLPEAAALEAEAPEVESPEAKAPEVKSPEAKAPEVKSPEAKAPEVESPEAKAPEVKSPEAKSPDEHRPPPEAVEQPDGSFIKALEDGSSLRWTQRPNGTWRKPERKRAGWVGELERPRYTPPKNGPGAFPPGESPPKDDTAEAGPAEEAAQPPKAPEPADVAEVAEASEPTKAPKPTKPAEAAKAAEPATAAGSKPAEPASPAATPAAKPAAGTAKGASAKSAKPARDKHDLQRLWCLWVGPAGDAEGCQRVHEFGTVEDFWCMFHHSHKPSEMKDIEYSLFKKEVKPVKDDPAFAKGGRWIVKLEKSKKSKKELNCDEIWRVVLMALVGEVFEDWGGEESVCGATIAVRPNGTCSATLWLSLPQAAPVDPASVAAASGHPAAIAALQASQAEEDQKQVLAIGRGYHEILSEMPGVWEFAGQNMVFEDFSTSRLTVKLMGPQAAKSTAGLFQ